MGKVKEKKVKTRVAPSPTGAPHVGTAYIALFNWVFAKKHKGEFLLRIEDTDQARLVEEAYDQILEGLNWLDLSWDEGPIRQSERLEIYQKHAKELVDKGKAYFCFCSKERLERVRKEAQKKGLPPKYDGRCRRLDPEKAKEKAKSEEYVIRLKVPSKGKTQFSDLVRGDIEFENHLIDDQVLLKSDGYPTYHLAVVVDDYLMGVTHVLRGEDWISSTPKHIILYEAFGWDIPEFAHFPLLRERDRSKLSKRHGAVTILEFEKEGYLPEALLNFLALLGWSHPEEKEIFDLEEIVDKFDIERVSTTAPVFNREKLTWMNGEHIRRLGDKELAQRICDYLKTYQRVDLEEDFVLEIVPLVKERIKKLDEFDNLAGFLFHDVFWAREDLLVKNESPQSAAEKLSAASEIFSEVSRWEASEIEKEARKLAEEKEWKTSVFFMLLRIAISGQKVSPPLFESMEVLGKDKSLSRIRGALGVVDRS